MPSEDYSRWPPCCAGFWSKGRQNETNGRASKKKTMKTTAKKNQKKTGLLSRSEQLGLDGQPDGRPEIDLALRRFNRTLDTQQVLALLRAEAPRFFELAEVVGKWVWVQFSDQQPPTITSILAELGFHWNNTRQVWQHPCGTIRKERAKFDPRKRYRSYFAADTKPI